MTSAYFVIWWKLWSLEEIKKKCPLAVGQDSYVDGRRELSKRKSHPHCIHEGSGKQLLSRGSLFLFPAIAQFVQIKERPRSFHVRINAWSLCWCLGRQHLGLRPAGLLMSQLPANVPAKQQTKWPLQEANQQTDDWLLCLYLFVTPLFKERKINSFKKKKVTILEIDFCQNQGLKSGA